MRYLTFILTLMLGFNVQTSSLASDIENLPDELLERVLHFVPLRNFQACSLVSRQFSRLTQDERGAFKHLIAFKKDQNIFKTKIKEINKEELTEYSEILLGLRNAVPHLKMNLLIEEQQDFADYIYHQVNQVCDNLKLDVLNTLWFNLALLRSLDTISSSHTIEDLIKMLLKLNYANHPDFKGKGCMIQAFILLDSDLILEKNFEEVTDNNLKLILAKELGERTEALINNILNVADLNFRSQQYSEALEFYAVALRKNIELSIETNYKIACCYMDLKDWPQALKYYKIYFSKKADSKEVLLAEKAETYSSYAYCCMKLEDWEGAQKYFKIALDLNSLHEGVAWVQANYAYCCMKLKDWEGAQKYYGMINSPLDLNVPVCMEAAEYYFKLENWQEALKYYESCLGRNPNLPAWVSANCAVCCYELENYEEAERYYAISFSQDSDLVEQHCVYAAECYTELENWPEASKYYKIYCSNNPNALAWVQANYAYCCMKLEDWQEALRYYKSCLGKDPNLPAWVQKNYTYCCTKLKDREEAESRD